MHNLNSLEVSGYHTLEIRLGRFNERVRVFILRYATQRTLGRNILWLRIFSPSRPRK